MRLLGLRAKLVRPIPQVVGVRQANPTESRMTQTASARALEINAQSAARAAAEGWTCWGTLAVDDAYWADYGVQTGEELDQRLAWENYVDSYKETHNIKPRWTNWRDKTAAEWQDAISRI